jgi:RNA binding exosome subunit
VKLFLESLLGRLSEGQKKTILQQKESRLDEDLNFFIRFDKEKLLGERKLSLTDKGNCFHLRMRIAAFPAKREKALETIEKIFKVESNKG